jgi:hypothetical protein
MLATSAPLPGEGMIVLTASTLSEDAQESDALGGSFFTHYLLSGLRGAADDNGDRVVTVAEAFRYARDQTVIASSRTLAGTQHPTFHYDLRGRADLPLADLGNATDHGTLTLPAGASWLVVGTGASPSVMGEIAADAQRRTLSLPPGSYAVRGRTRDALLEGTATVAAARDTAVDPNQLDRTTYARLVRKGKGEFLAGVSGPFAGYTAQTLVLYRIPRALQGMVAGWTWVRPSFTLSPRISAPLFGPARFVTADLRATRTWDLGRLSFDLGFAAGGGVIYWKDELSRSFGLTATAIPAIPAKPLIHADATLGVSLPLRGRTYLGAELAVQSDFISNRVFRANLALVTVNLLLGTWL